MKNFQSAKLFNYIPLTLILFALSCAPTKEVRYEEKPKEDNSEMKLKPILKTMEVREREMADQLNIAAIERINFEYDKRGNLINKGKLSIAKFDNKGFLTETVVFDEMGNVQNRFEYKYNSNGLRTQSTRYDKHNKSDKIFKYEYDKQGIKIKALRYSIKDKLEKYYEYEYDSELNLIQDEWFDGDGNLEFKIENEYDRFGNKIESISIDESGSIVSKIVYKYDEKKKIVVEEQIFDADNKPVGIVQYLYKYFN